MSTEISHLFHHAQHTHAVAQMIYNEFWIDVVDGLTLEFIDAHLQNTHDPSRIPLSLIALVDGKLVGTVNLIESDDDKRTHLRPWLAAMVVAKEFRGRGIVRSSFALFSWRLSGWALQRFTSAPTGQGFYERIGAVKHEHVRDDFLIMRFELAGERP